MLRLREYIEVNVFALQRSQDIDCQTFKRLKKEVTQFMQAQKKCHCTICGKDIFTIVFVFDGYSFFCQGCETQLGGIKGSVYVLACLECQQSQSTAETQDNQEQEQEPLFIKQIKRPNTPLPSILIPDTRQYRSNITPKQMNFSSSSQNIVFSPNQEKSTNQRHQTQKQFKASMLREKHETFSPLRQQLNYFNDEFFEMLVGYANENIGLENAEALMQLMKGWTFRNSKMEKKLAKLYGLNEQLKKKYELEKSIEFSEDQFSIVKDSSSDSNAIIKLKQNAEGLQKFAQFYIEENP